MASPMSRFAAVVVVLAGCASGKTNQLGSDSSSNGGPDSKVYHDAFPAQIDARVYHDAHVVADAHVYHDAHVFADAHVYNDAHVFHDACVPLTTELLANPVFDVTPVAWTQQPIDPLYPDITGDGFTAQSAPYKVWLGGFTGQQKGVLSVTDVVYQNVVVPAGTTQLVLTGYYAGGTAETSTTTAYDTAALGLTQTNGTPIESVLALSNLSHVATWTAFSHTFTANVAGQTVRLRMTSTNDYTNLTNFFFDTFSLKATHCP
jgi:hypothetical protein